MSVAKAVYCTLRQGEGGGGKIMTNFDKQI